MRALWQSLTLPLAITWARFWSGRKRAAQPHAADGISYAAREPR